MPGTLLRHPLLRAAHATAMVLACTLALSAPRAASAATTAPGAMRVEAMIKTLRDPHARARLIADLELLAHAQGAATRQHSESPVANALRALSERLASFGSGVVALTAGINAVPQAASWLASQAGSPTARARMGGIALDLLIVMGCAYLALWLARRLIVPAQRGMLARAQGLPARMLRLAGGLLLDAVPIAAFAVCAYLAMGVVVPHETARLVALAWVNAAIAVRAIAALGRAVFAARAPALRLPHLDDESAAYAEVWLRRLSVTGVYGYLGLQTALLLGLPAPAYVALLRLLGLVLAALVVVLVMQNRAACAAALRGHTQGSSGLHGIRERLARIWHLLALFYVAVLYGVWALDLPGGFLFILRGTLLTAVALVAQRVALRLLGAYFRRGLRVPPELSARYPGVEVRANRYMSVLHKAVRGAVYVLVALAVLQAWGMDALTWLLSSNGRALGAVLARVLGIAAGGVLAWEVVNTLIEGWLAERTADDGSVHGPGARARTLLSVARNAALVVIATVSSLMVLSELGLNIGPMLAGAGVLGLAVGFGSQKLVNDVVTGVFILMENLIEVGDVVTVGGHTGVVEAISIRTVRLRDLSGTVHTLPYSAIGAVSNLTRDFAYYVLEVGVAYREDTDEVVQVLQAIGEELRADETLGRSLLGPLEVLGVDQFADSAVIIKARLKTLAGQQWAAGREFNRRMKKRFDELGIEIPFPHTTVYFGVDKQGEAPPAFLRLQEGSGRPGSEAPAR